MDERGPNPRKTMRELLRTRPALAIGLLLLALIGAGVAGALRSPGTELAISRAGGFGRAVQGGSTPIPKPKAGVAEKGKLPKPVRLSKPSELHLKKAHSAVFDARKLKGTVVKRERPEHPAPDEVGTEGAEGITAAPAVLPAKVSPSTVAAASANAPAPGPDSSFDGLDFATWGAGHPPDENGDVGPSYYIQTVNTSIGIYSKSTGSRVAAFTFDAFMSQGNFGNLCDTDNFGDPVVVYDSFEDRWVISDFAFKLDGSGNVNPQTVYQCFAVSKTGDPVSGGWNYYSILAPGGLADYPKFGVWPDGLYMSANMFGYSSSGSYFGYHVWAINKQQMYAGAPTVQVVDFAGDTSDFTVIPANARLQAGSPLAGSSEYFVSTEQFLNALSVYKFHVDWDKISTSTFTGPFTQLAPNCWPNASPANASTPANSADVLGIRAMAQAQYTNLGGSESLWVDHTVQRGVSATSTTCNAPTGGNATVRWYQANVTGGTVAANVVQGATFDPDAANTFFRFTPGLAVDRSGDLAVGYTKSNSTTYPQIKYAGRLAGDPANTLGQGEQTLINGAGAQSGNCGSSACTRWGDYSGMALDPNGCEYWMTGEYYATTGLNDQTRIGSFHYPGCTTVGNGTLSGSLTDGTNPVAGATVALGNRTTTTNGSGSYSFTVPAGTYSSLSATKAGFDPASTSTIAVPDGGTATRNFTLNAAAQSGCFTDNSQTTFQRGAPTNCDLVKSPGTVVLANPDNTGAQNTDVSPTGFGFSNTSWAGQTFTPTVTGQLKRVDVELFCSNCTTTGPNITLSVRNTTGITPVPTGSDLATATLAGFNDGAAGGLKTFTFATPITLTAGTRYAFIFRSNSTFSTGTYAYTCSCATTGFSNSSPYANGQFVTSATSGSTWAADTTAGGRDLNFVTYINPGYTSSGTFVSSLKDANPAPGSTLHWTTLSFSSTTPAGTAVKFQVAGSDNPNGPFNYVGPDGTASTFFTSGASLTPLFDGFRYLRYKAFLSTTNPAVTPSLSSVQVCFQDVAATGSTSLAVDPATGTFGGTTALAATLTSGGSPVSGKSVSFTLRGSSVGTATTNASGVASLSGVSLAGIDAGTYATGVAATFAGDGSYGPSSASNSLTISRADQTINVTTQAPASAVYNTGFGVAATGGASGNPVTFSSSGACMNSGAGFTMTSGTGTCSVKYDQAGNGNYAAASQVTESVTAQKADQTVTVTTAAPASARYGMSFGVGASAPGGTVGFSSSGACSNSGPLFTMTSGTGTCIVKYDQAGDGNYNAAQQVTESVSAQQALLTITANDRSKLFGQTLDLGTTAFSTSGLAGGDAIASVTLTSGGAAAGAAPGTYPIAANDAVAASGTDLANYAIDYKDGTLTVSQAAGIVGLDSMSLARLGAVVDSFDSAAGPYGGSNVGSAASLFSNGAITLTGAKVHGNVRSAQSSVAVKTGSLVTGDVTAGTTITNAGTINGAVTANSPGAPLAPTPVAACSPYSAASGISGTFSYNAARGDLTVKGHTATIASGTYCFHSITLSSGGILQASGPVVLVLNGKLTVSGGGNLVNATNVPANLEIRSSLVGSTGVSLAAVNTYLTVYAPRTGITLSSGSKVFGALLGKTLAGTGDSTIHFDIGATSTLRPASVSANRPSSSRSTVFGLLLSLVDRLGRSSATFRSS